MDTMLVYSRMTLIMNLSRLWLNTKWIFSMSVPHNSSRLCYFEVHQLSTEDQWKLYLNLVCECGINFTTEVRLDSKNILICVLNDDM